MTQLERRIRMLAAAILLTGWLTPTTPAFASEACWIEVGGVICFFEDTPEGPCLQRVCCIGGNPPC